MLNRKPKSAVEGKPRSIHFSFKELKKHKYDLKLTGDEIAVLQDMMLSYIMDRDKLTHLVDNTSGESVSNLFNKITENQAKLLDDMGIDVTDNVREVRL